MGLNETLDRLQREREQKEEALNLREEISVIEKKLDSSGVNPVIREYAERIFFGRMLKDINHGLSLPKIEAMIERSLTIATMLARKYYGI